jgi:hypothetical protein
MTAISAASATESPKGALIAHGGIKLVESYETTL